MAQERIFIQVSFVYPQIRLHYFLFVLKKLPTLIEPGKAIDEVHVDTSNAGYKLMGMLNEAAKVDNNQPIFLGILINSTINFIHSWVEFLIDE